MAKSFSSLNCEPIAGGFGSVKVDCDVVVRFGKCIEELNVPHICYVAWEFYMSCVYT